jgi:hypothetical protein
MYETRTVNICLENKTYILIEVMTIHIFSVKHTECIINIERNTLSSLPKEFKYF